MPRFWTMCNDFMIIHITSTGLAESHTNSHDVTGFCMEIFIASTSLAEPHTNRRDVTDFCMEIPLPFSPLAPSPPLASFYDLLTSLPNPLLASRSAVIGLPLAAGG